MSGFEVLKEIIKFNKEQEQLGKEEEDNPTSLCPYCVWELDINGNGEKACPICERIWK